MTTPSMHLFAGNYWCTATVYTREDGSTHCGHASSNAKVHYLDRADLYRAATAPRLLPDNFVPSLRYWLFADATDTRHADHPDPDQVFTDPFTTALRAVISTVEEARAIAEASRELGRESTKSTYPNDQYLAGMHTGENHQSIYIANMVLRAMTQELYRQYVPMKERVM